MLEKLYKMADRDSIILVLLISPLCYLYYEEIQRLPLQLRGKLVRWLAWEDSNCIGKHVIKACAKEKLVKVLFVVDTGMSHRSNRRFARNTFAKRRFTGPIHWLAVFRMVGSVTDQDGELAPKASSECRAFGDIVVHRNIKTGDVLELEKDKNTSSYLQFVPWILENCPHVDLVVFMQDNVIPNPFYLPKYRMLHMDRRPEVIHCHSLGAVPTPLCHARSVVMVKKAGLKPFAGKASVVGNQLILHGLEATDIGIHLAVNNSTPMLFTGGKVLFYELPRGLNGTVMALWKKAMSASQNRSGDLRL